jgi:acyl carrier protein
MTDDREAKILAYLNERLKPAKPLTASDALISSGLLDSLGIFEFIAFLESTFSVRFSDVEMVAENFETAASAGALVAKKSAA